ncbi:MAG: hypothetical protein M1823_001957 [Watsoniomyces obsoletus]|nr:MAG: hypothetical protein M1823_001957 [Watsoniomyces obsoletus]
MTRFLFNLSTVVFLLSISPPTMIQILITLPTMDRIPINLVATIKWNLINLVAVVMSSLIDLVAIIKSTFIKIMTQNTLDFVVLAAVLQIFFDIATVAFRPSSHSRR